MISKATSRFIRMSPQKARLVVDLIRGKDVNEALMTLKFTNIKMNAAIPDSVFDLKLPKDVKVIKM